MSDRKIRISAGSVSMEASLNRSETADLIWDALPFDADAKVWGDEIYFDSPVSTGEENAQAVVPSGTIAYWPPGAAFCVFFGQKPASPVNVIGGLNGEPREFAAVRNGDKVQLERAAN